MLQWFEEQRVLENGEIFFSNKVGDNERIALIEEDKVVSDNKELAEQFKSHFETLEENLGINSKFLSGEPVNNESVTDIMKKF